MLYIEFEIRDSNKFNDFQKVYELLSIIKPNEEKRSFDLWVGLIPPYARTFIAGYYKDDQSQPLKQQWGFQDMVSYLQFDMEVHFDYLKVSGATARIGMSAYAFPYGGMDRFLVFLKSYKCLPIEAFNGFEVIEFHWESDYDYEVTEKPEKSKQYLAAVKSTD